MVQHVEKFSAKLQRPFSAGAELLEKSDVQVVQRRSSENIAAGVSKREGSGNAKRRGIEPLVGALIRRLPTHTGDQIGPVGEREISGAADLPSQKHRKGPAALDDANTA